MYGNGGNPKSWDKTPRTYEIKWPDGKKVLWKDITVRDCLKKNMKIWIHTEMDLC
jgi:hypothetical protein